MVTQAVDDHTVLLMVTNNGPPAIIDLRCQPSTGRWVLRLLLFQGAFSTRSAPTRTTRADCQRLRKRTDVDHAVDTDRWFRALGGSEVAPCDRSMLMT